MAEAKKETKKTEKKVTKADIVKDIKEKKLVTVHQVDQLKKLEKEGK